MQIVLAMQLLERLTERPIISLSLAATFAWNFHKAFIETQVVSNRVLPAFFVLLEVRKALSNVVVDLAERRSLLRRVLRRK